MSLMAIKIFYTKTIQDNHITMTLCICRTVGLLIIMQLHKFAYCKQDLDMYLQLLSHCQVLRGSLALSPGPLPPPHQEGSGDEARGY